MSQIQGASSSGPAQNTQPTKPTFMIIVVAVIVLLIGIGLGYFIKKTPESNNSCPTATPCPANSGSNCPVAVNGSTCPSCPACSGNGSTCPSCPACSSSSSTTCISPKLARYVILQRKDNRQEYINISEIEVYDKDGSKITSGMTATLDPPYSDTNVSWGADKAIDGNRGTIAHTNNSGAAYIKLDLGSNKLVSKVIIRNRMDCCMDRIVGCSLILQSADETETYKKDIKTIQSEYVFIECDNGELNQPVQLYFPFKSGDRKCMDTGSIWQTGYGDWPCDQNNLSQRFYLRKFPNQEFQIRSWDQLNCLDTGADPWDFRTCNDSNANQRFKWLYTGNNRNIQQISLGKECLDLGNINKHSGCSATNTNQNIAMFSIP